MLFCISGQMAKTAKNMTPTEPHAPLPSGKAECTKAKKYPLVFCVAIHCFLCYVRRRKKFFERGLKKRRRNVWTTGPGFMTTN